MKTASIVALVVITAGAAAGAGYLLGQQGHAPQTAAAKAERKVLYYRNPMGLPDTSPVPKKDSMGMDYVPVYEGEEAGGASVAVSPERMQLLGVATEAAQMRALTRTVRASAVVQPSERKLYDIAPRFAGWVKKLHVNATGERVTRGQPLLTLYSPELESAVREYQLAEQAGLADVARSTKRRLQNWEISERDLAELKQGAANLVLRSPIDGVVLGKPATDGARFAAGEVLFKLADLSTVWVQAQVAEQDQGVLRLGQPASVTLDAYPGESFHGRVSFIAPVLDAQTRTVEVRVELPNPRGRLRPGMFATVDLSSAAAAKPVLTVPQAAVIDTGTRQVALVRVAPGRFAAREVKLGQRAGDYVEVLSGLAEGEQVVTRANFLLDAESNLKAALGATQAQSAPAGDVNSGGDMNAGGGKMDMGAHEAAPAKQAAPMSMPAGGPGTGAGTTQGAHHHAE